jgi:hypothetical protein
MKSTRLLKFLFLGFSLTFIANRCSVNEEASAKITAKKANEISFLKSPLFDWKNKKVEVSFEDDFENFESIDTVSIYGTQLGHSLSNNNLKQGIIIKLKVIDRVKSIDIINEIMIESYDLSSGINQFNIGFNNNKPFIIY